MRPTSPHLSIYRWQITNTLSILHRITGFALTIGSLLFVAWLWSAAYAPLWYEELHGWLSTIVGKILLLGWAAAFYYHLGNGLRHLTWDIGQGMEIHEVVRSGKVVIAFTVLMTALTAFFTLTGGM